MLIRLAHDFSEVYGVNPVDLMQFGGEDVVIGVTVLTHAQGEDYPIYLHNISHYDGRYPDLRLKPGKRRDINNNAGDPVGLPSSVARHPETAVKMPGILDKYDFNLHHLSGPHEQGTQQTRKMIELGRKGVANPKLIIPTTFQ